MRLVELGAGCLEVPATLEELEVTGVTCDSREVRPGFLFVAVRGETTDGHLYAGRAEAAGAVAIVGEEPPGQESARPAERPVRGAPGVPYIRVPDSRRSLIRLGANFYGWPQERVTLTGVTGTKGKTTTTWILDAILRVRGRPTALLGTVLNRVGDELHASRNTTPPGLEVQRYLHDLVELGGRHASLEVSSHGIAQKRLAGLTFRCGVLTNISPEHLDYHRDFESYVAVKSSFFEDLSPDSFAVLPREDPSSPRIAARTAATICWYGADVQDGVERLRMGPGWLTFEWKGTAVRSTLWGLHNLQNVLAAMTAAQCLGFSPEEIAAGVEDAVAPPGRLEEVTPGGPFRVFVDYAHTDGALDALLRTLRSVTRGRLITVFGCGGDRDREKRPRMGKVAEKWSHHVVVTSDNPRSEDPEKILSDIAAGLERPDEAVFEPDRRAAIGLGVRMAREDDIVVVAGKGHETYQETKEGRAPFDDRDVVREFLTERIPYEG